MIVSASYRTDIPAYYGDWFLRRLEAGYADVRNPYGGGVSRVTLDPASVDGFVFWTRNQAPFRAGFAAVQEMGRPFSVQMTVTGYPRALEPGVIAVDAAVAAMRWLAADYGREAPVWRYDPVLLSEATPPDWHRENVARLAARLAPYTTECVLSFAHIYRKSQRNLDRTGLAWRDPPEDEKRRLLADLAAIIRSTGMQASLCAQPDLLSPELEAARCIDAGRLSRIAGAPIEAATKGARPGCLCAAARDIGRYDSCPQGCAYCYANASRQAARRGLARHEPTAERL